MPADTPALYPFQQRAIDHYLSLENPPMTSRKLSDLPASGPSGFSCEADTFTVVPDTRPKARPAIGTIAEFLYTRAFNTDVPLPAYHTAEGTYHYNRAHRLARELLQTLYT